MGELDHLHLRSTGGGGLGGLGIGPQVLGGGLYRNSEEEAGREWAQEAGHLDWETQRPLGAKKAGTIFLMSACVQLWRSISSGPS